MYSTQIFESIHTFTCLLRLLQCRNVWPHSWQTYGVFGSPEHICSCRCFSCTVLHCFSHLAQASDDSCICYKVKIHKIIVMFTNLQYLTFVSLKVLKIFTRHFLWYLYITSKDFDLMPQSGHLHLFPSQKVMWL